MKLNNPALLIEKNLVDGQWVSADSGATLAVTDAATGALKRGAPLNARKRRSASRSIALRGSALIYCIAGFP